ncbi:MAG TPA: hypothetical protein VHE61_22610 [Opitutaceae bacterium]|nr:hypothetical protein [Opitutaceae bacterium]
MNAAPVPPPSPTGPTPENPVPAGWTKLPTEHLPPATFWPAGLALAITFVLWGFISSWVVLGIGIGLFAVSLTGWITDLRHESKHHP